MTASQRIVEIEDQQAGRTIPQWRYFVALYTGFVAIIGARILGNVEGRDNTDHGLFDYGFWWSLGIWVVFLVVFQSSLIKYRRRALI